MSGYQGRSYGGARNAHHCNDPDCPLQAKRASGLQAELLAVTGDETVEEEQLVISSSIGEDGNIAALMKTKPPPEVIGRAMIASARSGYEKIVSILLKSKADANSAQAAQALDIFVKEKDMLQVIPVFLQYGLRPESAIGGSIFEFAADKGKGHGIKGVQEFLKYKLNPESDAGYKGLTLAAQSGHEAIVRCLLVARASPTSHAGGESLKSASFMGQFKVVNILLDGKADASSTEGCAALNCAVHIGNNSLVELLLDHGANPSSGLPAASFRGNLKFVKLLLEEKADASSRKKAMKEAARFGHEDIMSALLRSGTDTSSSAGDSALRLAVCSSKPPGVQSEIVQALQEHGARRTQTRFLALPELPGASKAAKSLQGRFSRTFSHGCFSRTSFFPRADAWSYTPSNSRSSSKSRSLPNLQAIANH